VDGVVVVGGALFLLVAFTLPVVDWRTHQYALRGGAIAMGAALVSRPLLRRD
jgi:hypothetical protein